MSTFPMHILSAAVIFEYIMVYLILHIIDVINIMYIDCIWNANLHNSSDVNSLYISRQRVNITNLLSITKGYNDKIHKHEYT